jgi:thymidine kinase
LENFVTTHDLVKINAIPLTRLHDYQSAVAKNTASASHMTRNVPDISNTTSLSLSSSSTSTSFSSQSQSTSSSSPFSIHQAFENIDVIGIDEGQFFPDILTFADNLANHGKIVVIAALDGTFERQPFENIVGLISRSEQVTKLTAICQTCGAEAPFTMRTSSDTQVKVIGGKDKYQSVCRKCHPLTQHLKSLQNYTSTTNHK